MAFVLKTDQAPDALGPVTFVLKRATGEIEIRGRTHDHLHHEKSKHPEYQFDDHTQINETMFAVTGRKAGVSS